MEGIGTGTGEGAGIAADPVTSPPDTLRSPIGFRMDSDGGSIPKAIELPSANSLSGIEISSKRFAEVTPTDA